jgi:hypothetical protein
LAASAADGVNVAALLVTVTTPDTSAPARVNILIVAVFNDVFRMLSEKETVITEFTPTAIEPFDGEVADTLGSPVSATLVVASTIRDWPETFLLVSTASTVYVYCVDGVSPVSSNEVSSVTVATRWPFLRTV